MLTPMPDPSQPSVRTSGWRAATSSTSTTPAGPSCTRSIAPAPCHPNDGGDAIMPTFAAASWLGWAFASAAGYAAGMALWQSIGPTLRPLLSPPLGGLLHLAAFGAALGLSVGLSQALVLR